MHKLLATDVGRLIAAEFSDPVRLVRLGAAREAVACDLALIGQLEAHIAQAEARLAGLLPATQFAVLTTVNGWATVRVCDYAAAVSDPSRWPSTKQLYRASGRWSLVSMPSSTVPSRVQAP